MMKRRDLLATGAAALQGGWNLFAVSAGSEVLVDPAVPAIRANGPDAWIGWPTSPVVEQLYQAWFQAPDPAGRLAIAREMQVQTWQDAPWTPPAPVFPPAVVRGA